MIGELNIPSKNIRLGYANYSHNANTDGEIMQFSPLKGNFIPNSHTAGTFEAGISSINDLLANYFEVGIGTPLIGKQGYTSTQTVQLMLIIFITKTTVCLSLLIRRAQSMPKRNMPKSID